VYLALMDIAEMEGPSLTMLLDRKWVDGSMDRQQFCITRANLKDKQKRYQSMKICVASRGLCGLLQKKKPRTIWFVPFGL